MPVTRRPINRPHAQPSVNGELLGSVAVLATLVYLALQTRQNALAIGAQLDAARIGSLMKLNLTCITSSELQEALAEDRIGESTINQERRNQFWFAEFFSHQWNFVQGRRGLLPTFNEAGSAIRVRRLFNDYRSFEGWWATIKPVFRPEFVEWVEEQRSKAA